MKILQPGLFLSLTLFVASAANAQNLTQNVDDLVRQTNERRISTNQAGMWVFGGWAVANIGVGTAGYFVSEDENWKYFHQMNAGWNIVNLAIATFSLLDSSNEDPSSYSWLETIQEGETMQKVLLLNAGLDVGYMAFGGYLWQRGSHEGSPQLTGYGQSLILQGAFLMAFDLTLFVLNHTISNDFMMLLLMRM